MESFRIVITGNTPDGATTEMLNEYAARIAKVAPEGFGNVFVRIAEPSTNADEQANNRRGASRSHG